MLHARGLNEFITLLGSLDVFAHLSLITGCTNFFGFGDGGRFHCEGEWREKRRHGAYAAKKILKKRRATPLMLEQLKSDLVEWQIVERDFATLTEKHAEDDIKLKNIEKTIAENRKLVQNPIREETRPALNEMFAALSERLKVLKDEELKSATALSKTADDRKRLLAFFELVQKMSEADVQYDDHIANVLEHERNTGLLEHRH